MLGIAYLEYYLSMYVRAFRTNHPEDDPYLRPWKVAKDATWLSLLVGAYLQYYFVQVSTQIASLPTLSVMV
ncbi:MAG: hypothetical protein A3H27_18290 [Acidobacteria bacterium RIFCSPLOWO2_02_FULL_59_13]|nr:MAG: hypothetical protein A3H27_18290 [Acidobacteria bacterium RIFCSPLOWO2_02_FULL_59_13]